MPPRLSKAALPSSSHTPLAQPTHQRCQCLRNGLRRSFSSTPHHETRQRRIMYRWLNGPGSVFRNPLPGSTNYLNAYDASGRLIRLSDARESEGKGGEEQSSTMLGEENVSQDGSKNIAGGKPIPRETADDLMPFPLNKEFRSQSVLSEELKDEIYKRVDVEGKSVRVVSAEMGVEMSRVGAVVRLKSVEKEWMQAGKPLASPYARAVLAMLPQTPFTPGKLVPHESINDLPVHRDTLRQLFHPVSESRRFTRVDAGKVFSPTLLPADDRIPHPELVELAKVTNDATIREEKVIELRDRSRIEAAKKEEREARKKAAIRTVHSGRWDFRFENINAESVGGDERSLKGVGARYGVPHQDRKRAQIKIPRRVE